MFYVTLPSNGDLKTFPDNHPGKFKAQLPNQVLLPGKDWEVALASITFPSVSLSASSVYDDVNYDHLISKDFLCGIELNLDAKDKNDRKLGAVSYWLKGEEMKDEYRQNMSLRLASRHGVDFFNRMLGELTYILQSSLPVGLKDYFTKKDYSDGNKIRFKWPQFRWEDAGGVYRLKIDNEGVVNGDYTSELENAVLLHLDVAKSFNIVIPKKDNSGYELTSLITAEHFRDPLDHVKFVGDFQQLWAVVGGPSSGFSPAGTPSNSYYLKLSCAVNWYIYEIDNNFHNNGLHQPRPLYLYSDIGQTQSVGTSQTDLLRKVEYWNGTDQGIIYEPRHLQFLPVRKNAFDTVEFGISETDGSQTRFSGGNSEATIITLCFRRKKGI